MDRREFGKWLLGYEKGNIGEKYESDRFIDKVDLKWIFVRDCETRKQLRLK